MSPFDKQQLLRSIVGGLALGGFLALATLGVYALVLTVKTLFGPIPAILVLGVAAGGVAGALKWLLYG